MLANWHRLIIVKIQQEARAYTVIALKHLISCEMPFRYEPLCFCVVVIINYVCPLITCIFKGYFAFTLILTKFITSSNTALSVTFIISQRPPQENEVLWYSACV